MLPPGSTRVSTHFLLFQISGSCLLASFLLSCNHSSTPFCAWTVCKICTPWEQMICLRLQNSINLILWVSGGEHSGERKPKIDALHLSLGVTLSSSHFLLNVSWFWSGLLLNSVEEERWFWVQQDVPLELVLLEYNSLQSSTFPEIMRWSKFTPYYWFFFNYFLKQKGQCHSKHKMHLKKYSSVKPSGTKVWHPQVTKELVMLKAKLNDS